MIKNKITLYLLGKKEGFDMNALKGFVTQTQHWTSEQWRIYHNEHIPALIQQAYNNVPFYRQWFDAAGIKPEDIRTVDDLIKIPIVRKADLIAHGADFRAENASEYAMIHHHTGGTTGTPCAYDMDRYSWALNWALKMRTFEWGGYTYGEDELGVMAGGSLIPGARGGWKNRLWRYVNNYYSMPASHLTTEMLEQYYSYLRNNHVRFLRGYPSALTTLAEYIREHHNVLPMQAVFTTAEMLLPHQRKIMEEAFQCKLFDTYGCGDGMGHATECEVHGELHVCEECSILQIVDERGKEVHDGEEGEIVLTALYNYGFPFIRYAPGDRAVKSEKKCTCGRETKMIRVLNGRSSDNFKLANGKILNAFSLPIEALTDEIFQFQVVQEAKDKVSLLIVPKKIISNKRLEDLRKLLEYHCGEGIQVNVMIVEHINVPQSGKMRFVVSKI
ncbi:MAG: phenylacetate--CoA ligase family protein [Paludibacteraceae bacterium]|nr:phenylacetate--CoA ligase family protein [Paludibacteraceae bacterium]